MSLYDNFEGTMAIFIPSPAGARNLPTPLNGGERHVANEFWRQLDDEWNVYIQPRLLTKQPDFIAVHPRFGVCVIEVKDWTPGLYRQRADGVIEVFDSQSLHIWVTSGEAPRYQAHQYRTILFERFFAEPQMSNQDFPVVRAAVILPQYRMTKDVKRILHTHTVSTAEMDDRIGVYGGDDLKNDVLRIVTGYKTARGMNVPSRCLDRLHAHLAEPEAHADERRDLRLSESAENIARNPSNAKRRRVRGAAGSGKSLGLAARAAKLAAYGQDVLVVGFNITLPHYLHDLAARRLRHIPSRGPSIRRISFTHFHGFCNEVRCSHAIATGHGRTLTSQTSEEGGDGAGSPANVDADERVENSELVVDAALAAYESRDGTLPRYRNVFVDEGQDFPEKWLRLLHDHVWTGEGEFLFVADSTQDVYERVGLTDQAMRSLGFGNWTDLEGCYRLPPDLVPIIREFAEAHLASAYREGLPLAIPADRDACEETVRRWRNVPENEVAKAIVEEIQHIREEYEVAEADIAYLCETHRVGLEAARLLEETGLYATYVFTDIDDDERRKRKRRFWGGTSGVKGCTVHSFKGWEARAVVLAPTTSPNSALLTYIALTRVKGDPETRAAVVSVINSDPNTDDFAQRFERPVSPDEAPALRGQRRWSV